MLKKVLLIITIGLFLLLLILPGCYLFADDPVDGTTDEVNPTVMVTSPADGTTDVPVDSVVTITFSEAINAALITSASFTLAAGEAVVTGTITYDDGTYVATFTPDSALNYATLYTATLTTAITDIAGNALVANIVWSFTTAADAAAPVPGASGVITTAGVSDTALTLNWSKASDNVSAQTALQYQVYYSTTNNIDTVTNIETNGTTFGTYTADIATLSITGLTQTTTYYFNLIVKDEAGNKAAYTTVSETTGATPDTTAPVPDDAGNLGATGVGATSLTLDWMTATDNVSSQAALQYQVYYSLSGNIDTIANIEANGTALGTYTADIASFEVTGLTPATTYYFNVIVKDEAGNKGEYVMTFATTLDAAAPVAGNSGIITASNITDTSLTLNWTKASDDTSAVTALQYQVYSSTINNIDTVDNIEANGTMLGAYAADIDTLAVTDLAQGTTYYFNVIVKDEADNKAAYTMTAITTLDATAPVVGNSGTITTSTITATSITLDWTKAADDTSAQAALQYQVYYSTTSNIDTVDNIEANGTALGTYTADIATYVVADLTDGTAYYFNIIVKDEMDNKAAYTMATASTLDVTAPVPGNSGTITMSSATGSSVIFDWTTGTDNATANSLLEYLAYYSTTNNIDTVDNIEANGTAIGTYTQDIFGTEITDLAEYTTYYVNVIIRDEAGNKAAYTMQSVMTLDATVPTPGNRGSIGPEGGETVVALYWTEATDDVTAQTALEYQVYYSTSNNVDTVANIEANGTPASAYTANIAFFEVTGLSSGTTYYFNVIVRDEAGNKAAYMPVSVTTTVPNTAPYVTDVTIDLAGGGDAMSAPSRAAQAPIFTLEGFYTYHDAENDPEGASTYRWLQYDDEACTTGETVVGTAKTLGIFSEHNMKYFMFEVTPAAEIGTSPGTPVMTTTPYPVFIPM